MSFIPIQTKFDLTRIYKEACTVIRVDNVNVDPYICPFGNNIFVLRDGQVYNYLSIYSLFAAYG